MPRKIVTGDVHGCLDELKELLVLVEFKRNVDELIFVGDFVDRGPDSAGVVRFVRELQAKSVVGNHDERYVKHRNHLRKTGKSPIHLGQHKQEVYASLTEVDLDYLESLPLFIRLSSKLVIVHAGLRRGIAVEHQKANVYTHMRYAFRDTGEMAGMKKRENEFLRPATAAFWTELWTGPESVIYGHHPHKGGVAVDYPTPEVICIGCDTGACFGGELSCVIFEDIPENMSEFKYEIASVKAKGAYAQRYNDGVLDE